MLPALRALSACAWAYETCGIEQVCLIVCRQLRCRRGEWFRALCLCLCLGGGEYCRNKSSLHHPLPAIRLPDPLRPPLLATGMAEYMLRGTVHARCSASSTADVYCATCLCTSVRLPLMDCTDPAGTRPRCPGIHDGHSRCCRTAEEHCNPPRVSPNRSPLGFCGIVELPPPPINRSVKLAIDQSYAALCGSCAVQSAAPDGPNSRPLSPPSYMTWLVPPRPASWASSSSAL